MAMQIDVVIAFFLLGVVARLLRADIHFPVALHQTLTLFLLLAIGLKGGVALAAHASWSLLPQALAVVAFGLVLPLLAFPLLRQIGHFTRVDAASVAAHYGSVSIGTYAVGAALLEARAIPFESYFPFFVALLEVPAIAVGLILARQGQAIAWRPLIGELGRNQGLFLLLGSLLIGVAWAGRVDSVLPLFRDLFHGALALFLLDMGLRAASRLPDLRQHGPFIAAFGVFMPLLGGLLGGLLGWTLGLSTGGVFLLAVLGASASYIAVPAAMQVALPEANQGLAMTASLGVTFPFNVLAGLPVYALYAHWLTAA